MKTDNKQLKQTLATLGGKEKRSALFLWLVEHHDEILEAVGGGRIDWLGAVERFAEAGLTDATGKPASARRARATWYKVRRFVATRRANSPSPRGGLPVPPKVLAAVPPLGAVGSRSSVPAATSPPREVPAAPPPSATPGRRPLKVFRSFDDIKPYQPPPDDDPAADSGASGILPPPRWPKPVL
jgi:hypothetical protein